MGQTPVKLEAVIFDLDGTLIDSAPDLHAAVTRMLGDLDRSALSLEAVESLVGNGTHRLVEQCLAATGGVKGDMEKAFGLFTEHYSGAPAQLSRLYPGVLSALAQMHTEGIRLGVCTNKPQALSEYILRHFRLMPLISVVAGGGNQRALKPDPAPLLYCIEQLHSTRETTLYVGDSEVDEETAKRATLPFALYFGGYRKRAANEMRTVCVFNHHDDLLSWVLKSRAASSGNAI